MNTLVNINSFQFHPMHRRLIDRGGNRKLSDNSYQERWSKPSQQLLQQQAKKLSTASVKLEPSQNDVICARGRTYWDHPGNQFYRKLISLAKKQYSKAPNRPLKTLIVSEIISHIHKTNGRFVKKANHKGGLRWIECSAIFIREKVTQSLRDGLSFKYSSSTSRKRERKIQTQEIFHADIDRIVHSNAAVSHKIKDLQQKVEWINRFHDTESEGVSDEVMLEMFVSANLDILETMKKDPSMSDKLNRVKMAEISRIEHNESRTENFMLTTIDLSIERPTTLESQSKAGPSKLQSSSELSKSSVHNNEPFAASEYTMKLKRDNKAFTCDDMDLDLESPSMFLDDW